MGRREEMKDASCQERNDCTGLYEANRGYDFMLISGPICRVVRQLPCWDIYELHNVIQLHNRKRESDMVKAGCMTNKCNTITL